MKALLMGLLLSASASSLIAQERWVRVTEADEELIEVDRTSAVSVGPEIRVRIRSVVGQNLWELQSLRVQCDSATLQVLRTSLLDAETGRISEEPAAQQRLIQRPQRFAPGSRGAQIVQAVCTRFGRSRLHVQG